MAICNEAMYSKHFSGYCLFQLTRYLSSGDVTKYLWPLDKRHLFSNQITTAVIQRENNSDTRRNKNTQHIYQSIR